MNNRFHQAAPQSTEMYRASTKSQLWLDHRRKHCACGKTVTEKDMRQYGGCFSCYKAAKSLTNAESAPVAQALSAHDQEGV